MWTLDIAANAKVKPRNKFNSPLGLIFATLKLLDVIHWSWWLVLLPVWGTWAIAAVILAIYLIYLHLKERVQK